MGIGQLAKQCGFGTGAEAIIQPEKEHAQCAMQQLEGLQVDAVTSITQLCTPPHARCSKQVPHASVEARVCSCSSSQHELGRHVTNRGGELQEADFRGICSPDQRGPSSMPAFVAALHNIGRIFPAALRAVGTMKNVTRKDTGSRNQEEPITNLINQWRSAAQQAILDFQEHMAEPKPGLKDILSNFQIEPSVIGYSEDDDCFV
ncbi:hypothetical protein HPB50_020186 [Hyalomma asiaticum]|uniref:Uncharacterized protein n=1 Tax=Hyalomma asiaticum TaxID=266040 RepID=A0ACB7TN91_HYAAI|nr:hypothetical protein HPB50_020186 [Hyalomma asiaticum]